MIKNKEELLKKFDDLKDNKLDLSSDEDLSIAIMNLISIEEHFFFTGEKTGNPKYYEMLAQIREMRKELLGKIITQYEGEVWCISKHLLAASMRLMEVGTKHLTRHEMKEAEAMFDKSFDLYSMFWGLNLGAISTDGVKKIDDKAINKAEEKQVKNGKKSVMFNKTRDIVKNLINCCIE